MKTVTVDIPSQQSDEKREKQREYQRQYYNKNIEKIRKRRKKWQENNPDKMKLYVPQKRKKSRVKAYELISEKHGHGIQCWKCGETRIWCLTVAHLNDDGGIDREKYANFYDFSRAICRGDRAVDDLEIECWNCNMCKASCGLYPNDMTIEIYLNGKYKQEFSIGESK